MHNLCMGAIDHEPRAKIYGDWYHHEALNLNVILESYMYIDLKKVWGTFISGSFLQKIWLVSMATP